MGQIPRTASRRTRSPIAWSFLLLVVAVGPMAGCVNETVLERRADAAAQAGEADAELAAVQEWVERFPGDYAGQLRLGEVYLGRGEPLKADTPLTLAHDLAADSFDRRQESAELLAEAYACQDAEAELTTFLRSEVELHGTSADYRRLGRFMDRIGDHDAAADAFEAAGYFAEGDDVEAYLEMASFYESIHDQDRALLALRYAYTADPENAEVAAAFRRLDIVPGPTWKLDPPKAGVEAEAAAAAAAAAAASQPADG